MQRGLARDRYQHTFCNTSAGVPVLLVVVLDLLPAPLLLLLPLLPCEVDGWASSSEPSAG